MVAGGSGRGDVPVAAGSGEWFAPLVGGLVVAGAVSLSAWFTALTVVREGVRGWDGYYGVGMIPRPVSFPSLAAFFTVNGAFHSGTEYYLGWYWLVVLAGGCLAVLLWLRHAGEGGRGRGLLAGGALAVAVALTAPLVALVIPALSGLWMNEVWVLGVPALLVIGVGLAVMAWLRRSRRAVLVLAGYAMSALLAGWLLLLPRADPVLVWLFPAGPGTGWREALLLSPLTALLLPALVLLAGGLAGFVRWRRGAAA